MSKPGRRALEYGVPTDRCSATVLLGIDRGFFRDEGIDLSLRVIFGGPELSAAFDTGAVVIGEIGSPPAVTAISQGARFKAIGGGVRRGALMFLGARTGIEKWDGLRGKRVGVLSKGSCTDWVGRAMLGHAGLVADRDVEIVPLGRDYSKVLEVMLEGKIDAMVAGEPHLAIGETSGDLTIWAAAYEPEYLPRFQWYLLVANTEFLTAEPETAAAFLRAYQRSAIYAIDHVDELVQFSARRYDMSTAAAYRAVSRELPYLDVAGTVDLRGLQVVIDLQQRLGAITRAISPEEILDPNLCRTETI